MDLSIKRLPATSDTASTVVFLHGLFGQGKNFNSVARALTDQHTCLLVDLPNHGHSPHTETFSYEQMAQAVAEALASVTAAGPVHVVGHSMGGKVAMVLALDHPAIVERLVVEDSSPVDVGDMSEFNHLLSVLRSLDVESLESRGEADAAIAEQITDDRVRAFLLQNLRQSGQRWHWLANLALLHDNLPKIAGFPVLHSTFDGPTLWMAGERSTYVQDAYEPTMRALFPKTLRVTIKDAGHWIHSEQPEAFVAALRTFLAP